MLNCDNYIFKFFRYETGPKLPDDFNVSSITCEYRAHCSEDHSAVEGMIIVTAIASDPAYKLRFGLIGIYDDYVTKEISEGITEEDELFVGQQLYKLAEKLIDRMIEEAHICFPCLTSAAAIPRFIHYESSN